MTNKTKPLGIIAGWGVLPLCLLHFCQQQQRPCVVVALKGQACPKEWADCSHIKWVRLGGFGAMVRYFKSHGVRDIVLIGAVRRPGLWEIWPDFLTLKLLFHLFVSKAYTYGDDGLLRHLMTCAEQQGFHVVGIDTLMPQLKMPSGVLGRVQPGTQEWQDIAKGLRVAQVLGKADIGQSVVVQQGLVLAVEGIEGTDALILRAGALKRRGGSGVLVKTAKPQQDQRVDLPTIGPQTIENIAKAKLKGLAVQAGKALLVEQAKTIALANHYGLFIVGVEQ